ncbi:MAG: MaoC family dehydratase [Burkholderiaceae bacterium]
MRTFEKLTDLKTEIGNEIGASEWLTVTQEMIDLFAEATGDHQWIHVDPEKAAAGPFGTTIAHGFLTLSLLPRLSAMATEIHGLRMGVNYGLNKVRFPAPVPAGSELRAVIRLLAYEEIPDNGAQITTEVTIERKGGSKPVCVAESLSRRYA